MKAKLLSMASIIVLFISLHAVASYSYPESHIKSMLVDKAEAYDIAPALALAVAKVESDFNAKAISHAGARGVMQLMPLTAERVFGVHRSQLFDAEKNIELGVKFLKQLLDKYDQRLDIALSHYNGGSAVRRADGSLKVIASTQGYVDKVLSYYRQYEVQEVYSPYGKTFTNYNRGYQYQIGEPETTSKAYEPTNNLSSTIHSPNMLANNSVKITPVGMQIKGPTQPNPVLSPAKNTYSNHFEQSTHNPSVGYGVSRQFTTPKPVYKRQRHYDATPIVSSTVTPLVTPLTPKRNHSLQGNSSRIEKVRQWESIF